MFRKFALTIGLLISLLTSAQNIVKHKVLQGETITQIAQKYHVTPFDIYKLNPDAQKGLQADALLLIPNSSANIKAALEKPGKNEVIPVKTTYQTHTVLSKETIFGIAKQYEISEEDLYKVNTNLEKEGLKIGSIINIPKKNSKTSTVKSPKTNDEKPVYHEVLEKETKYSIAKKYGITVEALEAKNPEIVSGLQMGYKLLIKGTLPKIQETVKEINVKKKPTETIKWVNYEVKSKETLYSLSKKFSVKQDDLTLWNPDLANGLKEGMVLKIPATATLANEIKKNKTDLKATLKNQDKKKLVMLLPFNSSKIKTDSVAVLQKKFKEDQFLNLTMDFYSGALMAIDSAKSLGINVDVTILDSEENKNSSNVDNLANKSSVKTAHAIIGPFYQAHAEKLASILEKDNIPVISPLSKEMIGTYKNMYASMPTPTFIKDAMYDYMEQKNGNILAVIDPKKAGLKKYIVENQKETKIVALSDKGAVVSDNIKALLVKDKLNFVVMASDNSGMILTLVNQLIKFQAEYQIRLVMLEQSKALNFEEIAMSKLTKLQLTYPSLTRENETADAKKFERAYKKLNKTFPNQYATRGFDITFDTLLRLSQEKDFETSINDDATVQIDNKFDYEKIISGGYINKGVFILQYNNDLTITEAP